MHREKRDRRIERVIQSAIQVSEDSAPRVRNYRYSIAASFMLLCAAIAVPPWFHTYEPKDRNTVYTPAGYHFLLAPPKPEKKYLANPLIHGVKINYGCLGLECAFIVCLGIAIGAVIRK